MKNLILSAPVLLLINLPGISALAQTEITTYIVSNSIGDTLSLEERDYYKLFPQIEGFQWAVFSLNPDSTLNANIKYSDNGLLKDTLIENYKSLKSLNYQTYARDALEKGIPESAFEYKASLKDKGANVCVYMNDGGEVSGELLSVRQNSLLLFNPDCDERLLKPECINQLNASEIDKLVIEGNSNLGWGIGLGLLASVVVGAFIYSANYQNTSGWFREQNAIEESLTPIILSSIGLITLGTTIGIYTSTPDEEIETLSESDIRGLSLYSRYPSNEPTELKKVK